MVVRLSSIPIIPPLFPSPATVRLKPTQTNIVGGARLGGNAKITGTVKTKQAAVSDPLANLAAPNPSTLQVQSRRTLLIGGNQVVTLKPGIYIGGIAISGKAKVTLGSGIYYLQGGGFSVSGNASVTDLGKVSPALQRSDQSL